MKRTLWSLLSVTLILLSACQKAPSTSNESLSEDFLFELDGQNGPATNGRGVVSASGDEILVQVVVGSQWVGTNRPAAWEIHVRSESGATLYRGGRLEDVQDHVSQECPESALLNAATTTGRDSIIVKVKKGETVRIHGKASIGGRDYTFDNSLPAIPGQFHYRTNLPNGVLLKAFLRY